MFDTEVFQFFFAPHPFEVLMFLHLVLTGRFRLCRVRHWMYSLLWQT